MRDPHAKDSTYLPCPVLPIKLHKNKSTGTKNKDRNCEKKVIYYVIYKPISV